MEVKIDKDYWLIRQDGKTIKKIRRKLQYRVVKRKLFNKTLLIKVKNVRLKLVTNNVFCEMRPKCDGVYDKYTFYYFDNVNLTITKIWSKITQHTVEFFPEINRIIYYCGNNICVGSISNCDLVELVRFNFNGFSMNAYVNKDYFAYDILSRNGRYSRLYDFNTQKAQSLRGDFVGMNEDNVVILNKNDDQDCYFHFAEDLMNGNHERKFCKDGAYGFIERDGSYYEYEGYKLKCKYRIDRNGTLHPLKKKDKFKFTFSDAYVERLKEIITPKILIKPLCNIIKSYLI